MKKIFAIALALVLVLSMGSTAFAVEYVGEAGLDATDSNTSFEIYGKVVDSAEDVSVIAVDVSYGAMRFVFAKDSNKDMWNPSTHSYDDGDPNTPNTYGGKWYAENKSNFITVTNHSNVAIDVKLDASTNLTYMTDNLSNDDGDPVTVKIKNETDSAQAVGTNTIDYFTVARAVEGSALDSQQATWSLELEGSSSRPGGGEPFNNMGTDILEDEFKAIGSVTVSIKEASQVIPTT